MSEQAMTATGDLDLGRTVRLTIPAKPEYITLSRLALAGLARVRSFPDEMLADLKLALTEACSNSVRHAYEDGEGHVDISFELRDDRLIVEVADDGTGIAAKAQAGVGLVSLRERAAELGGRSEVTCPAIGGTVVRAWLPLAHHSEGNPP